MKTIIMKTIIAKIKEPVEVRVTLQSINFNENWLEASNVIEHSKRKLVQELKEKMHNKIAELSADDIDFKIEDMPFTMEVLN